MRQAFRKAEGTCESPQIEIKREMERTNAKLRHFRGVAASVLSEALAVWQQIWESCRDPRTCDEILEGTDEPDGRMPQCGWHEFRERLHLLRHYIEYTQRLCAGSIEEDLKQGK